MSLLVEIRPILSSDIGLYWDKCAKLLEKSLKYSDGEWTMDCIHQSLVDGNRNLWVVFKGGEIIAAITTRVDEYPSGKKVVAIDFAGGKSFKDWNMFTDYISPFYSSIGCDSMEIAGRLGWLRLHTDKGFKMLYYVMRKELNAKR